MQDSAMSAIPSNLKFLDSHEWARLESDGTVTIGISDHAQNALGDLVFVEVPEVGKALTKGGAAAVVESVKAASDVYSPVSGEVIAANDALGSAPELVNTDPYGQGWLYKIKPANQGELEQLLTPSAYEKVLADEAH
jgi:glycine cleavage system H protein